jgi:hypothetical protein
VYTALVPLPVELGHGPNEAADAFDAVPRKATAATAATTSIFFIDYCPPIRARMRK